ncbi:hypothetical protein CWB58_17135 [Pseudoalteromonas sp. S201]|uniref:hypothetical protein n=1 Tax=Pseudoalteromonas sp. S201 TaxID=579519 RepID=UPI00110CBF0B|nr:hypothetical protein [Pseudoalteromonas sp. S201]TMS91923.1 hypothetical protein CWB58_17135 [Pseudoalteromonas sp. S201]
MRKIAYTLSLVSLLPALLLLLAGIALIPAVVIADLGKGHLSSLVLLLPLIGAVLGIISSITVAFELLGWVKVRVNNCYKYLGMFSGIISELSVIFWFTPNIEPFLTFWLPPMLGSVILIISLYLNTTNKPLKRD